MNKLTRDRRLLLKIATGVFSLCALLAYTWVHTGSLLARYVEPAWVGFLAAAGIEVAVVALSAQIGDLRRHRKPYGMHMAVLIGVLLVSTLANIGEGFYTRTGEELTRETLDLLDPIQGVLAVTATGLLSLIVFALADLLGTDVSEATDEAVTIEVRHKEPEQLMTNPEGADTYRPHLLDDLRLAEIEAEHESDDRPLLDDERYAKLLALYTSDNPPERQADAAKRLGVSRSWVSKGLKRLEEEGLL